MPIPSFAGAFWAKNVMKLTTTLNVLTCAYLAAILALIAAFHVLSIDAWAFTVVLYSPRWVWTMPGLVLLPIVAFKQRKLVLPLAIAVLLVVWLVMGFCVPWRTIGPRADGGRLRILTCNCGGNALDASILLRVIREERPEIVALQECRAQDADLIKSADGAWHFHRDGDLVLLSRLPIRHAEAFRTQFVSWRPTRAVIYELSLGQRPVLFANVHLDTPREGFEALLHKDPRAPAEIRINASRRRDEAQAVAELVQDSAHPSLLAGDFNLPVESSLYKSAFATYKNAFSRAGWGFGYTKFTRWHGIRIDHVLASQHWTVKSCRVGPSVGSDHRPVIADVYPGDL